MADLWSDLLACLELTGDGAAGTGLDAPGRTVLVAGNLSLNHHRLYGGQLLAQLVRAAAVAGGGKDVKSLHAVFPEPGIDSEPVRYEVTRTGDGRSFAALTLTARQAHGVIATAVASLHRPEDGLDRQTVADPGPLPGPGHEAEVQLLPWEVRFATDPEPVDPAPPVMELWMRTPEAPAHAARPVLAYATDLPLIGTALLPMGGISANDSGRLFSSAVTSHSLWFHRPFRTDEWLLLRQESPIAAGGRSFGRGDVLTQQGLLVASYAQEALLRF